MSRLLINEPPLQVLPSLAVKIGLNEAIVLQQVHYWLERSKTSINGHLWVYNSVSEWRTQFPFWSDDTISRALKSLRARGVVIAEQLSPDARDRSMYYRIDYSALSAIDGIAAECTTAICGNGSSQVAAIPIRSREYTENTPQPPKGEAPAGASRGTTLRIWLEDVKTKGEQAIPENDPVFAYAEKTGIPDAFLHLAWRVFKDQHTSGAGSLKRQKSWRQTFRTYVEKGYMRLWYINAEGQYALTTAGIQAQRAHEVSA